MQSAEIRTWVEDLRSLDYDTRLRSTIVLGMFGPEARGAVPDLILALAENDIQLQRMILAALNEIGLCDRSAIPKLIEALGHPHFLVRRRAAAELARLGPEAGGASPALVGALSDSDVQVRRWAITALGLLNERSRASVQALVGLLDKPDIISRAMVVVALSRLAAHAWSTLAMTLRHENPLVRRSVVRAMARTDIEWDALRAEIGPFAEDPDETVRESVESLLNGHSAD